MTTSMLFGFAATISGMICGFSFSIGDYPWGVVSGTVCIIATAVGIAAILEGD